MLGPRDLEVMLQLEKLVEAEGGTRLQEPHTFREVKYGKQATHCGCNEPAQFAVAYESEPDGDLLVEGLVNLCGICDMIAVMPRFELDLTA